jgi:sugar O-acyltransferase (sialic acid O-acetyltransferase NeuD family)
MTARNAPFQIKGFLDDRVASLASFNIQSPVLGSISSYQIESNDRFILAFGDAALRFKMARALQERGAKFISIIHPTAYISAYATVEEGCVLGPFAFVGPHATLGKHVILNTYASAGHDATLRAYSILSPYAVVNGNVECGEGVFLGTHAVVTPGCKVGEWSKVGAGTVVTRSVDSYSLAVGTPAKARQMFSRPQ